MGTELGNKRLCIFALRRTRSTDATRRSRMFRYRRLIVWLVCLTAFSACVSTTPPASGPVNPTPAPLHGYHITLYDQNGNVTERYDVGPSDIEIGRASCRERV